VYDMIAELRTAYHEGRLDSVFGSSSKHQVETAGDRGNESDGNEPVPTPVDDGLHDNDHDNDDSSEVGTGSPAVFGQLQAGAALFL
jgi:hypothetical protein